MRRCRLTRPPDADSELYDPNDAAAVAAYWSGATIKRGVVKA
jgi:hypothetical protein